VVKDINGLKNYKMKSINDRDVLFFANDSKNASQYLYFLTMHRIKLISLKNYQFTCAKSTFSAIMG
jgi:hypothetical protein